ncbi:hypothetical protein N2597_11455 [Rhizobium sophoriradicis]|uniref:hypothetical protein n=1 Tax=Rhizobium sophoriradicis TaxID=1535245 RepID=UPI001620186D|nr:hypothetical protein N2597_11455 [Rhizobium leguminosarum bv. phaseoli]
MAQLPPTLLTIFLLSAAMEPEVAYGDAVICVGRYKRNCPEKHDYFYTCGTNVEKLAEAICGAGDPPTYNLLPIVTQKVPKGVCDYRVLTVACKK